MESKKKGDNKQQEDSKAKGQANGGHGKGTDDQLPRTIPPPRGRDNKQGRSLKQGQNSSSSSAAPPESRLPWRLILLVSILAGGAAVVCVNEPARSLIGDVYHRHIRPQALRAAESLSGGLAAVRQMAQGDSASHTPLPKQDPAPSQQTESTQHEPKPAESSAGDGAKRYTSESAPPTPPPSPPSASTVSTPPPPPRDAKSEKPSQGEQDGKKSAEKIPDASENAQEKKAQVKDSDSKKDDQKKSDRQIKEDVERERKEEKVRDTAKSSEKPGKTADRAETLTRDSKEKPEIPTQPVVEEIRVKTTPKSGRETASDEKSTAEEKKETEKPGGKEDKSERQAEAPSEAAQTSEDKQSGKSDKKPSDATDENLSEKPGKPVEKDHKKSQKPAEKPDSQGAKNSEQKTAEEDKKSAPKSTEKPDSKSAPKSTEKPDSKSEEKSTEKPDSKSAPKSTEKPDSKSAPKSTEKPDSKSAPKSTEKPDSKSAPKSTEKPDSKSAPKSTEKPDSKSAPKSTEKPDSKSEEKSKAKPGEKSESKAEKTPKEKPSTKSASEESTSQKPEEAADKSVKEGKEDYAKAAITNSADFKIRHTLDEAQDLLEKGKHEDALRKFDNILRKHPTSPRAQLGRADTLDEMATQRRSNELLEQCILGFERLMYNGEDVLPELMKITGRRLAHKQQFRGWGAKAVKTFQFLVEKFPEDVTLNRDLGVSHLMVGQSEDARRVFQQILKDDPRNGFAQVHLGFIMKTTDNSPEKALPLLIAGIDSQQEGTQDGRFYFHLGDAYQRLGREEEARKVYQRGAAIGLFLSADQRSLYNVDGLTSRPWWTPQQTGYHHFLKLLEDNWQMIREEGLRQLDAKSGLFKPEAESLREKGDWKQLTMYQQGRQNKKVCEKVPKTCALVEQIPEAKGCKRGQVKFSVMQPGVHVWPHCGPTNCRIRAHLGLVVPKGPRIRVANETRTWTEGKFILFDDSFEHEVWHDGSSLRMVLIVDFWHPDLTADQRRALAPI